ncbi:MAG: pantetheine-phosphate adenylyltransferase [Bacteroidales bacterium]|nr:pantetheine-phosphate adenylyltransferase [Bacteroidales bacterium]
MYKTALFPGSFDPFTIGHESIVNRALPLFDKIIIAIGYNTTKDGYFPLDKRLEWIKTVFGEEKKVEVTSFKGLTVDFCREKGAGYILRGLRTSADFEYERAVAQMNRVMLPDIESVFMLTLPDHTHITSTIVREIIRLGGDADAFLPENLRNKIKVI